MCKPQPGEAAFKKRPWDLSTDAVRLTIFKGTSAAWVAHAAVRVLELFHPQKFDECY